MQYGFRFEEHVRRTVRALWELGPGEGAAEILEERERDLIFNDGLVTHYVEITTDPSLEYVRRTSGKMLRYRTRSNQSGGLAKLWIVTEFEPTAHQRTFCKSNGIEILSIKEFRRKLFNGPAYLAARPNRPFGSATDPGTDNTNVSAVKYQATAIREKGTNRTLSIANIISELLSGRVVVLLGDYGMGKSIAVREIYRGLADLYENGQDSPIPVSINLRECWGLTHPYEVFNRHADSLGLKIGPGLVKAFNGGLLTTLLDGFDETAANVPWVGAGHIDRERDSLRQKLKTIRREAVSVVREFVNTCRGKSGLLVAGRENFFDTPADRIHALGLHGDDLIIELDEFTDEEAKSFLAKSGIQAKLPQWLPRRPLLLASLVAKGFIDATVAQGDDQDPAYAWHKVIDVICERESRINKVLDSRGIRLVLEELAERARITNEGLGPVNEDDFAAAFRAQVGDQPDNTAWPLLMRLPGLTVRDTEPGSRYFLDDQLLMAFRAGNVTRLITSKSKITPLVKRWVHGLSTLGANVVRVQLIEQNALSLPLVISAIRSAGRAESGTLSLDLVQVARAIEADATEVDFQGIDIKGGYADHLDLSDGPLPKSLTLRECTFQRVSCTGETPVDFVITDSIIDHLYGVSRKELLPAYIEQTCDIDYFDPYATNNELLEIEALQLPLRVLLTILRKLYVQGGSGRNENAFTRGMNNTAGKYVGKLLSLLSTEGLASLSTAAGARVWHPNRKQRARVLQILESPAVCQDPVVQASKRL